MDDQKREKYIIALAGLFHDIGKFYQRTNPKKKDIPEEFHPLINKEIYSRIYGYQHALYSHIVLMHELKEGLQSVFSKDEISVIGSGVFHHKPIEELHYLLQKADWVSSSEREKAETEFSVYIDEFKSEIKNLSKNYPRLRSIFEKLNLSDTRKKLGFTHKITPLNLSEDIFPKDLEEDVYIEIMSSGRKIEELLGNYKPQWEAFKKEFNDKLKTSKLKFKEHPEKTFSLIYHILYKYLWCIPASTYDSENYSNHYPDISLFDHSRVLSAVACCFFDYGMAEFQQTSREKFRDEFKNKNVFLHLKADISGIQNFIYNVHTGKGGVAKTLRGRSFYITLLPEVISRYILNELGYPISNLIYSGGGIFEILLANTEETRKKLDEIVEEIEEFFAENFEANLGIAFGVYEYSPVKMMDKYKDVLKQLNENLDNAKKRKFKKFIETGKIAEIINFKSDLIEKKKKCPVCQTYLIEESLEGEKELCELCETFRDIGGHLPKTEKIVFAKERTENFEQDERVICFDSLGVVYLVLKDENIDKIYSDEETIEILNLNDTNLNGKTTGFKFLGNTVPKASRDLTPEETEEEEIIKEGQIAPFTTIAKFSEGDKRIGILRMDVDNLGKLFSEGIKNYSISRVATLSRMLDLFFAGYVNTICKKLSNNTKSDTSVDNLFYILYSGGDDLFIVAPWDKTIELASEINKNFRKYVSFNPDVTVSAGYIQTKPKFPIRVSADLAGEAEKIAKDKGKNRICILGDVLSWEDLEEAKKQAEEIKHLIQDHKLKRSFIYAIHRLKEQFLKKEDKKARMVFPYKEQPDSMFYPYAHYYIARNIEEKKTAKKIAKILLDVENIENLKRLTFLINYVALKIRK
ncbi:type III-A CRISPR-associated protein Cas10/Csm1 [Persephonella sp.]